jgi:poly(3-hydroxybutyrate) depolymerase
MRTFTLGVVFGAIGLGCVACASNDDGTAAPTDPTGSQTTDVNPTSSAPNPGPVVTSLPPGPVGPTGAPPPVGPSGPSGPAPVVTGPSGGVTPAPTTTAPTTAPAPSSSAPDDSSVTGGESSDVSSADVSSEPPVGEPGKLPLGNPPQPSAGCGKATTLTTGKRTIRSSNQDRSYIIDIPNNYDMNEPHRLFYTSHWIGSTSEAVRDGNYYGLKPQATAAGVPAIFVAPQSDGQTWQQKDHPLFDDLLAFVKENLCIDTTRVFATGFSFGGMITYSLSVNHQKDIRAAVGIAPANYNIWLPQKTGEPIAWMQTTGMSDGTTPWVNNEQQRTGAKFIAIEHATNNGCTVPNDFPVWRQGGHICYDFENCDEGYPTKACTFGGGHVGENSDGGGGNWIATESWKFFMQF